MKQQETETGSNERRRSARFSIHAPAVLRIGKREIWAITRDVSTCGVYFRISADDEGPTVGDLVGFTIKIPITISMPKPCFITGRATAVRRDGDAAGETGVAGEMLDFQIQNAIAGENPEELLPVEC